MMNYLALGTLMGLSLIRLRLAVAVYNNLIALEDCQVGQRGKEMTVLVGCVFFWPLLAFCLIVDAVRRYLCRPKL